MACGFLPNPTPLTPPFTFTNWAVSNPGTAAAFITIDSSDFFGNGLYDDDTTATATVVGSSPIVFSKCGNPAPTVSVVSRNRITLAIPNIVTSCDVYISLVTTMIPTPTYYRCGVVSTAPPDPACALTEFPAQSTTDAGCTVGSFPA